MASNNSAGRLSAALGKFQDYSAKDHVLSQAICEFTGTDHDTVAGRAESLRFGGMLADLCHQIRRQAATLPDYLSVDVTLESFVEVENALDQFTMPRSYTVNQLLTSLTNNGYGALKMLDRHFQRFAAEPTLTSATVEDLLVKVTALRRAAEESSELDPDLARFLARRFGDIERALKDADLTGYVPVEVAIEGLIGSISRQPGVWQRIAESAVAGLVTNAVFALFLTLSSPPDGSALPPGTPEKTVNNYVQIFERHGSGEEITIEIINEAATGSDLPARSLPVGSGAETESNGDQ